MGKAVITLKDGRSVTVEQGDTLFSSLRNAGIFIPTICGGRGFCGKCRVKIVEGNTSEPTKAELQKLTEEERASGVRLACQVPVEGDMTVELPEGVAGISLFHGKVVLHELVAQDIMRVKIALKNPASIQFDPGAFLLFDIPFPAPHVNRPYSIATPPDCKDAVEINVKLVPKGKGSGYMHNVLKVGDEIAFTGPYNGFPDSESKEPLLCIAGGSGISPVMSILRHIRLRKINRPIQLFFGAINIESIAYVEELRQLEKELPDFKFFTALRDPAEGCEVGLVNEVLKRHVPDASGMTAFICGSPGMVEACTGTLHELGLTDDSRIHFDRFG